MEPEHIEKELVLEEVKAQRNALADQLAFAGAVIVTLRKKLQELEKPATSTD